MQKSIHGRLARRVAALGLTLALLMSAIPFAGAITQEDIDALEEQQAQLQSSISSVESEIAALQAQEDTALERALLYQQQIGLLTEQINDTEALIADYDVQIEDTLEKLAEAQEKAETYYQLFCERVRDLEENGSVSYLAILFDASSFTELLDRISFIQDVVNYDNSVVDALEAARQEVADAEAELEQERAAQEDALTELESQQTAIQAASDENDALLAEVQANQEVYADKLAALESESEELADEIVASEAEYAEQQAELARKAAEEAAAKKAAEEAAAKKAAEEAAAAAASGSAIASYALQFVGNPYVWGGTSLTNGCDCSGFVMQVYAHFGISLSHSSWAQASSGYAVSASEAQPGDIVFYRSSASASGGHVGIYIGNGQMVSALGSNYGICVSNINYNRSGLTFRRLV